jgi:peptidoglycan/xylan/chitin deacetylase (PgdA/CDA1 family)
MSWAEIVAGGLYATGSMRLLESISGSYGFRRSGFFPKLYRTRVPKLVILCYHRVGTGGIPLYSSLSVDVFERQMRFVSEHYRVISLGQACDELRNPEASTIPGIVVTFDDGYRDTYHRAFPILRKYHVPATVFLTAAAIERGEVAWYDRVFLALKLWPGQEVGLNLDQPRRFLITNAEARVQAAAAIVTFLCTVPNGQRKLWCLELEKRVCLPVAELGSRMLTWEQVREMYQAGIVFGSHTMTHPVVSQLSTAEVSEELLESKRLLEKRIGCQVDEFAFPFGHKNHRNSRGLQAIEDFGYRCAVTTDWGCNLPGANLYELRRVQVDDQPSLPLFVLRLNQALLQVPDAQDGAAGHSRQAVRVHSR